MKSTLQLQCQHLGDILHEPRYADCAAYVANLCDNCHTPLRQMPHNFATYAKTSAQRGSCSRGVKFLQHFIGGTAPSPYQNESHGQYFILPQSYIFLPQKSQKSQNQRPSAVVNHKSRKRGKSESMYPK